jgi:hypothetical protein
MPKNKKNKNNPIPPLSLKALTTLLEDIERTGLPLDQVSLVNICDDKEGIYGAPGASRRPVQLRFQKIKDLTARGYRRLLCKYNITAGPATLAAEQQDTQDADEELVLSDEEAAQQQDQQDADDEPDEEEVNTDDNEDIGDDDIDIDLSSAFGSISIKSKMFSPEKKGMFSPTSGVSPGRSTTDTMPSSMEDHAAYDDDDDDDADPALDALDFRRQCGTKRRPYIILADASHPERNHPFDITPFEDVEHSNHHQNGFHIRIDVAAPDMNAWTAFIPASKDFSKFPIKRTVGVKGPSRSYWRRDAGRHHKKGVDCQVTKTAHEKTDTAIKADTDRQSSYFMIVFHKDLILDNQVFSGNMNTDLQPSNVAMKLKSDHVDNPFKKKIKVDVIGMCVWWRVAITGGTRIRDAKAEVDIDDLFGDSDDSDA